MDHRFLDCLEQVYIEEEAFRGKSGSLEFHRSSRLANPRELKTLPNPAEGNDVAAARKFAA